MSNNFHNPNFINPSSITGLTSAKGDLVVGIGTSGVTNLTVGSDGQILSADSAEISGVKWINNSGGSSGLSNILLYTVSNAFVVPTGITHILMCVQGGGGGGGAAGATTSDGAFTARGGSGGGGGSGEYLEHVVTVSPGETLTITVGNGGVGSTSNAGNGANGGLSSVTGSTSGLLISAIGGIGGHGGTVGNATTQIPGNGGNGGNGYYGGGGGGAGEVTQAFVGVISQGTIGIGGFGISQDGKNAIMNALPTEQGPGGNGTPSFSSFGSHIGGGLAGTGSRSSGGGGGAPTIGIISSILTGSPGSGGAYDGTSTHGTSSTVLGGGGGGGGVTFVPSLKPRGNGGNGGNGYVVLVY